MRRKSELFRRLLIVDGGPSLKAKLRHTNIADGIAENGGSMAAELKNKIYTKN